MLKTLAAVVHTVRRLVLAPSRQPCGHYWTDPEHRGNDPHRCGLRRGHSGPHECRIHTDTGVCRAQKRTCHCRNAGAVPRRGSDVGTSPLLGKDGG